MIINRENIVEVFRNLRATFNKSFKTAQPKWQLFATRMDTKSLIEKMHWLDAFPQWRRWVGDKVLKQAAAHAYNVELQPFETTVQVKKRDLEADSIGYYATWARSAGERSAAFPDILVAGAMNDSFVSRCYDGKPFFHARHPLINSDGKKSEFSNLIDTPLSIETAAAAAASYGAAKTMLRTMKDNEGEPIEMGALTLVVPAALEDVANALMQNDRLEDGKPNIYKGSATVQMWQRLKSDTAWFLIAEADGLKPFIYVVRKEPTPVECTNLEDSRVFLSGEYLFGAEADAAAAYTFPQLAVASTGTASGGE